MEWNIIWIIVFVSCLLIGGWVGNDVYKDLMNQRIIDGLYLRNYNYSSAKETAYELDGYGDWVCVNVKGMDFNRGIEVCQHECGHAIYSEIYAEICEKDFDKCRGLLE